MCRAALAAQARKTAIQPTADYGERLINAYETAEYYFGDIGKGSVSEGICVVNIEDIFRECVNTDIDYYVFLTPCRNGHVYIDNQTPYSFTVRGDDILFFWEVKAKRRGYEYTRLAAYVAA